jgi:hypothetical protein
MVSHNLFGRRMQLPRAAIIAQAFPLAKHGNFLGGGKGLNVRKLVQKSRKIPLNGRNPADLILLGTGFYKVFVKHVPPIPDSLLSPAVVTQFSFTGFIQQATIDRPNDRFSGGTIRVNDVRITVPYYSVLQMPAGAFTWQEIFALAGACDWARVAAWMAASVMQFVMPFVAQAPVADG